MCAVQLLRVSVHERISAAAEDVLLRVEKGEEAAEIPALRALLTERLTAAAEEIVGLFEETVAEYEDRAERSEREICHQRRLLDAVLKPRVKLHRADIQQLLVVKEEVSPEQQEWSSSLDQEDPEPPHIKEEQEELWTSQEGEQLQGLEEADITKFPFTPVPLKSEEDEEKPQSSQLRQRLTEQMETKADGEDCGGPEPARNSDPHRYPEPDTDDKTGDFSIVKTEVSCDDWKETREPQSALNSLNNDEVPVSDSRCNSPEKPFSCSVCGKKFTKNGFLETHIRSHTGEKPFSCSVCGKKFTKNGFLETHIRSHTGEKTFSCSVCGKKYTKKGYLVQHMSVHRGEKQQSCSVCNKRLVWHSGVEHHQCVSSAGGVRCNFSECDKRLCCSHHLKKDTGTHVEDNLFSCSVCGRKFTQRGYLNLHMARHTGKIRFRCCVCDKRFAWQHELKSHKCVDDSSSQNQSDQTGADAGSDTDGKTSDSDSEAEIEVKDDDECQSGLNTQNHDEVPVSDSAGNKSFICSECGKTFCGEDKLQSHMRMHTGEKPFSCSFCEKGLTQKGNLTNHMTIHTEEKRFLYCVCGKRFAWRYNLKNHELVGDSSQNRDAEASASSSNTSETLKLQFEASPNDCKETAESLSLKTNDVPESDARSDLAERPFGCSECAKRFRRKKNLQEHMRIHTGEKPYGCSVCMKYFSCSGSLRKHLRIHTGEKPFSCSVCGNRFTESGHLKVHMRTHTGEKPFSCSVCGKSFTWRQSFNNHMKYHRNTS